ncbi:MAG: hypothetical protein SGARI_004255, partial [Bacillariaceae sp.]
MSTAAGFAAAALGSGFVCLDLTISTASAKYFLLKAAKSPGLPAASKASFAAASYGTEISTGCLDLTSATASA